MIHDIVGTLEIALAVLASAVVFGGVAGFYDGRRAAWRAFGLALALASLVGCLQIFEARYLVWVLGAYGLLAALSLWRWRRSPGKGARSGQRPPRRFEPPPRGR